MTSSALMYSPHVKEVSKQKRIIQCALYYLPGIVNGNGGEEKAPSPSIQYILAHASKTNSVNIW